MIPDAVRSFLTGPRFAALAMVGDDGRLHMARAGGWIIDPRPGVDLTLVTRTDFCEVLPGQGASDRIAIALSEADRFVSYQLKGRASARPATDDEVKVARAMLDSLGVIVERVMGLPASMYQAITVAPAMAIDVVVEEAYHQSPGPRAGDRVDNAGGAA